MTTLKRKGRSALVHWLWRYLGATTKYVSVRPHTLRIFPGPSLWPFPFLHVTHVVQASPAVPAPHKATGSQNSALLPPNANSSFAPSNVGLGVGLMKSGQAERSLSGSRRAKSAACLRTQAAMGCVSGTLTAFSTWPWKGTT